jgi:hypothetical protein
MKHTTVGLIEFDENKANYGVTIISPAKGKATYLIGMKGELLHQWEHPTKPGDCLFVA